MKIRSTNSNQQERNLITGTTRLNLKSILSVMIFSIMGMSLYAQTFPSPGFTLPAGKTIVVTYSVDVNAGVCPTGTVPSDISNQSNVTGSNFATVQTDDPDIGGASDPTLTTVAGLTLGNLVYKDVNKNGVFDAGDTGIDGVTLNLYLDNGDGVLTGADGAPIANTTTAGGGLYSFSPICPGNYIVEIPLSNFNSPNALYDAGLMASLITSPIGGAPDPDNDVNNDDNGDNVSGFGVASQAITLSFGAEPTNDGDTDNNTNLSLDFGFKTPTTVTIGDLTLAEGTGGSTTAFNFTVTRSDNLAAFSLTVNTADGTAVSPSDFTAISAGSVSFTAGGSTTATVTVLVNQDNAVEANETFTALISAPPAGVVITDGSGLGTITNDDAAVVTLSGGTAKNETNAGTVAYVFTATLNNPVQGGFSANYTTNNGTATTADNDYADNDGALAFTGTAGESHDITVNVNGDNKVELDETFTENLNTITGAPAGVTLAGSPQTGTITNDDLAIVSILTNIVGSEASTPQTFQITISNPVDVAVTVLFNTANGSATTADLDYNAIVNQTVTFNAGSTTNQIVNVTINNDTKVENDEVYAISIGSLNASMRNVLLGNINGTGTIINDDAATVTLTGGGSANEGNSGTTPRIFTATLNNAVQGGFNVAYTTSDGTATTPSDYVDNDGSLAFTGTAGETKTFTVLVNGDNVVEANETYTAALGTISSAPVGVTVGGVPQTATIVNDEIDFGDAPTAAQSGFAGTYPTLLANNGARHTTVLGFQLGTLIDGEDDGQPNPTASGDGADEDGVTLPGVLVTGTNANITVNSSATGKLDAWVDFNRDGDFADAGEQIFTSQSLVAGNNSLSFAVLALATPGTSFARFRLSTAGGLSFTGLAADGEVEDYQVSIVNNQFAITSPSVTEGNVGTTPMVFTISRTVNTNASSVDYAITGGSATSGTDYVPLASGTINFTMGGALSQDITVDVNGDFLVENNETVIITLSNPMNGGIGTGTGTGTITNDDAAVVTLTGGTAKNETNAGTVAYVFTATLNNNVQGGFSAVYTTNNGTATSADNDYIDNDAALVFTGTAGESHDITVSVNGDNKVELNETFTETINSLTGAPVAVTIAGSPQTGTITNDDAAVVAFDGFILTDAEHNTPQAFIVTLSNPVDVNVTVLFNTSNGTATTADNDYNAIVNQTVTFNAGTTTSQFVNVTINDDIKVEDNETYNVTIGTLGASGRNVSLGLSNATPTILNDDGANLTLSGGIAQNEGNSGTTAFTFTATLNNPVQGGFTVAYTTNNGTATTADNDYTDNDASLNFVGNANEAKTITVLVNGDHKVEANETLTVALGALSGSSPPQLGGIVTLGSPQTGTINNDEVDFGDAPDTYQTLLSNNGARHNTVLGFRLGAAIDGEDDGQPNGTATGDGADEDGVTLPAVLITNLTANIVVNASASGKLDAWVDFNNNGLFIDSGEKVLNNVSLVAGNNNLSFMVPAGATPSNTFSRFRFSTAGGLAASGLAADGEVEDYAVQIVSNQFAITSPTVTEGNAGTTAMVYTISRTTNATAASVDYAITGGSATSGTDYAPLASGTINFTMGGAFSQDITVNVNGDLVVEDNETVIITLSNPVSGGIGTGTGTGTINNDDSANLTLTGGISQNESNAGTVAYTFTATLSAAVQGGFQVAYSTNDATATTADNDYVDNDGTLTFTGTIGETKTITVLVNGDTKVELNETFGEALGAISATSGTQIAAITKVGSPQMGTILNDDAAVVSIGGNITGPEATTPQTFTVTLSNPVDVNVTVLFNTSNGTATTADNDYSAVTNQTVTFNAGTTTAQTVNVTINNDTKVEDNEVYNVSIGTLAAGGRNVSLGTSSAIGTITNDDAATITLSGGIAQNEGNSGTTAYTFTATLSAAVQGGFTAPYTTNDGTATTADNDYVDNDASLVFTGTALEAKTITVLVNGDHKVEANETFTVVLGTLTGATPVQLAAITKVGSPQTGTITNDEIDFGDDPDTYGTLLASNGARHATILGFQLGSTIDGEDDGQPNGTATGDGSDEDGVTLPTVLITNVTANIVVNASAIGKLDAWVDFNNNGVFTDAGEKVFNNVPLVAGNNNLSFLVPAGATPSNTFSRFRFSTAGGLSATGTASDGEVEDYAVQIVNTLFSINDPTVTEGNAGTSNLTFTITRSNNAGPCSINYAITGGTATVADNDYQTLAAGTASFTAGGSLTQNVVVIVNGDTKVELNETVDMTLSAPVNGAILDGSGTGTITNDDVAVITITSPTINEPDAGISNLVFDISMSNQSDANVSFNYTTADGTATLANNDYTLTSGSHTLTPGQTTKQISVPIIGDCVIELNEIFNMILSSLNNAGRAISFSGGGGTLSSTGTIVNEDFPPVITFCPPNVTISCEQSSAPANTGTATATDDCPAAPVITFTDVITNGSCTNNYIITRTWKATDGTNDMTTCSQTITVRDITPPSLTCPPPVTVSCVEQVPAQNINTVTNVTDNCTGTVTVTYVGDVISNQTCTNRYTITRTYRATDICGNSATCSQIITVNDQTGPVITCPAPVTVSCFSQVPAVNTAIVSATDNCVGVPVITFVSDVTVNQTCFNRYTLNRTYRATDVCGNSSTCVQVITVNDQTPPSITCPAPVTVSCAALVPAVNTASVITSDNCTGGAPTVTFVSDVTVNQTCTNKYTLNRTYRATDVCGNSATCVQVITVNDIIAPTITCPANLFLTCLSQVPAPNIAGVIATDNCAGAPTIGFVSDITTSQTCLNQFSVMRTYRATDVCGNSATCTQTITVVDQIVPVINGVPADVTIQCTQALPPIPAITATDNCTGAVTLSFTESSSQSPWPQLCGYYSYTVTRTWIAKDACGNSSTKEWKIKVQDTTPPVWVFVPPAFLTVECDDDNANNVDPIPGDACDQTPSVLLELHYDFGILNCVNNYLATYTWTAGDKCGNIIKYVQKITVVDITGPEMFCPGNIVIVSLIPVSVNWKAPKVSDYCDYTPTTIQIAGPPNGSTFQPNSVTTIVYQSTDDCGNVSTCSFTVTIKNKAGTNKFKISGALTNKSNLAVQNVEVNMSGDINQYVTGNGQYNFVDLPKGANLAVNPDKKDNPLNGVNTLDIVAMTNHVLGKKALDSPYKLLAADVNNSKSITTADLVQVRKLILHIIDKFDFVDSWKFIPASTGFKNPLNPWTDPIPGSIKFGDIQADQQADFTAIKMGDVTGDATGNVSGNIEVKGSNTYTLQAENKSFAKNEEVEMLISGMNLNSLKAMQFTLDYDQTKLEYLGIKAIRETIGDDNFGLRYLDNGNITTSLDLTQGNSSDLFAVRFKAKEAGDLNKLIRLTSTLTHAEAYTQDDETIGLNLVFKQGKNQLDIKSAMLYQNEPNPFDSYTDIRFVLPETEEATISIFDLNGKLLKEIKDTYKKGEHTINFNKEEFPSNGVYYYQLKTNNFTDTKKMMYIR